MSALLFKPSKKLIQTLSSDSDYAKRLVEGTINSDANEFLTGLDNLSSSDRLDILIALYEKASRGTNTYARRRSCMRISPHDIVDARTFLFDKAYLNVDPSTLYPKVIDLIIEMSEGDYDEAVLTGAIGCVDSETEFLSSSGWKKVSEYQDEDLVAQVHESGQVEFTNAEYISGPAYRLKHVRVADKIDMVVSGNHRIPYYHRGEFRVSTMDKLISYRTKETPSEKARAFREAKVSRLMEELLQTLVLKNKKMCESCGSLLDRNHVGPTKKKRDKTKSINPDNPDTVSLITTTKGHSFGSCPAKDNHIEWFIACVLGRQTPVFGRGEGYHSCTAIGQKQRMVFEGLFSRFGYEFSSRPFANGAQITYKKKNPDTSLSELEEFNLSSLWQLDKHQAEIIAQFLCGRKVLRSGRGCLHTHGISETMVGFLQYAMSVAGFATGISRRSTRTAKRQSQRLWWHKDPSYISPEIDLTAGIPNTTFRPKDGKQYCFRTKTGLWLSRRAGKILVTGNSAKTTRALYSIAYHLYQLSCYLDPHKAFAMDPSSEIVIIFQSLREKTAKELDYARFKQIIDRSPYFQKEFPYDRYTESYMKFPNRIEVKPISSASTAAIGQNVIFGLIDEVNFMDVVDKSRRSDQGGSFDQAKEIYDTIHRRIESRFIQAGGSVPGILFLSSSRKYPGEFTDRKIEEAKDQIEATGKSRIYVSDLALWDIKPTGTYCGKKFKVFIGNNEHYPAILMNEKEVESLKVDPSLIIEVPIEHLNSFRSDILGSLRDLAGKATLAVAPFLTDLESIHNSIGRVKNAFSRDHVNYGIDKVSASSVEMQLPDEPRACHIDIGLTQDRAGIACGYVSGFKRVERSGGYELLPVIVIEAVLAVTPPKKGQIEISYLRGLIYMLEEAGYPVRWVTMDGYQSVDSLQIFKQHGYSVGRVSTDKTMIPYTQTKQALSDGRLLLPKHDILSLEWKSLEVDYQKGKVDHTAHSTKDVSDAVASVVHVLSSIREIANRWGVEPYVQENPSSLQLANSKQ